MKIIRIIPFLDFGGVEQRIKLTALAFQSIPRVELMIVVLGHGGKVSHFLEQHGIKPIIVGKKIKIPQFRLIFELYKIIKNHNPDVVHCSGAEANFHGLIAAKLAGVTLKIGEEIGFPQHHLLWKMVFKWTYRCADLVIGISKSVVDKMVAFGEVPPEKTRVIYNPVEIEINSTPILSNPAQFTFITVCRLVPVKNMDGLLKAFGRFVANSGSGKAHLQIVGSGPEKDTLIELCERLQIQGKVSFLGYQDAVSEYLRQADAFVLPSFSEGFSISLVEAMLCGLPCIVTKVGGPSEIIKEGHTGFLIDPYRIESLELALDYVYKMPKEERIFMGSLAGKDAKERFSVKRYSKELLNLYRHDK